MVGEIKIWWDGGSLLGGNFSRLGEEEIFSWWEDPSPIPPSGKNPVYIYIIYIYIYYIYIYKYIRGTNKTNTSKQLLVSCLHIRQADNM